MMMPAVPPMTAMVMMMPMVMPEMAKMPEAEAERDARA